MIKKDKSTANKAKLILLIGIPLLLVLSLALVFNRTKQQEEEKYPVEEELEEAASEEFPPETEGVVSEQYPQESEESQQQEEERKAHSRRTLTYAPLNPTSATATCQSTGEALVSGQATSCPDPLFTWSGEKVREAGTKIIGYWVYFGEKNNTEALYYDRERAKTQDLKKVVRPILDGQYQVGNKFTPTNLEKDKTYYLAVAAKSDSEDNEYYLQYGLTDPDPENLKARAAEILFTFVYR